MSFTKPIVGAFILRLAAFFLLLLLSAALLPASTTAVATNLSINREVRGDVLVLGGELRLGPSAHIHGDAIAIFGRVVRDPAARIDGHVLHLENLASLDPRFENRKHTRFSIFLLTAGVWLMATTIIGLLLRKRLGRALYHLRVLNWRILPFALLTQMTLMGALIATLGLGPRFAATVTGLVLALSMLLKALGLSLMGWSVGTYILPLSSRIPVNAKIFVGVLLFNLLRLLPGIGPFLWILLSVLAPGYGILVLGAAKPVRAIETEA